MHYKAPHLYTLPGDMRMLVIKRFASVSASVRNASCLGPHNLKVPLDRQQGFFMV
jgi:hypothetical protein